MGQQAAARGGGEGDGGLQLGVIFAARPFPGMGPGMVKDIFALAVGLAVGRYDPGDAPVLAARASDDVARDPAGMLGGAAARFAGGKEPVGGEGVDGPPAIRRLRAGASVPVFRRNLFDRAKHVDAEDRLVAHAL